MDRLDMRMAKGLFLMAGPVVLTAQTAQLPALTELPKLLQEVIHNQRLLDGRNAKEDYLSTVKVWTRWFDRKGGLKTSETETYEHYPASPRSILILTESNGVATPTGKLEQERAKALLAMEASLRPADARRPVVELENTPGFRLFLGVYDLLRHSECFALGTDTLDGRPMILLSFRPRPDWVDPKGLLQHLTGTLWIDAADRVVVKAKAWVVGATEKEGLFLEVYHRKVFSDMWALVYYRINPSVRPELFKHERFDWSFENSQFQRCTVDPGQLKQME